MKFFLKFLENVKYVRFNINSSCNISKISSINRLKKMKSIKKPSIFQVQNQNSEYFLT